MQAKIFDRMPAVNAASSCSLPFRRRFVVDGSAFAFNNTESQSQFLHRIHRCVCMKFRKQAAKYTKRM